jgi:sterol desaturase/sphingolipid hydroxylase (fatty acid hydroxylase superfamily)
MESDVNEKPATTRLPAHPIESLLAAIARLSTTRANGLAGLVCDVVISLALIAGGLWRGDVRVTTALGIVAAGLLLFSFVEYCFHRWLFHGAPGTLERGHTKHHDEPLGFDALPFFLPPLIAVGLAALLTLLMPSGVAMLLVGAVAGGYAGYGVAHTAMHHLRFQRMLPRRWAAAHHIHHHHPDHNFGVTTPLWDIVLGTRYVSQGRKA